MLQSPCDGLAAEFLREVAEFFSDPSKASGDFLSFSPELLGKIFLVPFPLECPPIYRLFGGH